MSDQHGNPQQGWGQPPSAPPPQQGWGPAPQQPPSPYGNQPPGSGYGGYGAPGATPPKKSRTGLIIGLVVVSVLVIAGVIGGIVVFGGDDSDDTAGDDTSEPTETASDEPEVTGAEIEGTGYTYTMPTEEWQDGTAEVQAQSPSALDTVAIWGTTVDDARSNILVETGFAGPDATLDDLRSDWETNLSGSDGAVPEPIDGTTIDGEEAIGVTLERVNESGDDITQVAYLTLHDGDLYSIAVSGGRSDEETPDAFAASLASWTWAA